MDPEPTEVVVPERFQQVLDGARVTCLKCGYPMVIDGTAHDKTMASIASWRRSYPGGDPIPARLLRLVIRCFSNGHQEVWHAVPPETRLERPQLSTERTEMECACGKPFVSNGKTTQCAGCRGRSTLLWRRMGALMAEVPSEESVGLST